MKFQVFIAFRLTAKRRDLRADRVRRANFAHFRSRIRRFISDGVFGYYGPRISKHFTLVIDVSMQSSRRIHSTPAVIRSVFFFWTLRLRANLAHFQSWTVRSICNIIIGHYGPNFAHFRSWTMYFTSNALIGRCTLKAQNNSLINNDGGIQYALNHTIFDFFYLNRTWRCWKLNGTKFTNLTIV